MDDGIVKELDLENNLHVRIYDRSKKLIGDRYQVIMQAEMDIPITQAILEKDVRKLKNILGDRVTFKQTREKTFIDEGEKEKVLNNMIDSFINDMIPYLSRPDFPVRFINKQYQDQEKRIRLKQLQSEQTD
ncbi:MAG: hypothetical protein C4522_19155 [Desulfobacteraceae bacterium]|nr:MAG: hypothetical protein C4522_19155 [Desulfobacteraceae bacterium]